MTWALVIALLYVAAWAHHWWFYNKKAEELLAEAGARLSLHCANPIDDDVCRRIGEHFDKVKRMKLRSGS